MMLRRTAKILICVAAGLAFLFFIWIWKARDFVLNFNLDRDWIEFKIPRGVESAKMRTAWDPESVTVCNESDSVWRNVRVQLNGIYVATEPEIRPHACRTIPLEQFAQRTWKKIPGYRGMYVRTIEMLASTEITVYARDEKGQ